MSTDPSGDPHMNLDEHPQDDGVAQYPPHAVRRIVDLLRAASGVVGRARVQWWADGYWHTLEVSRNREDDTSKGDPMSTTTPEPRNPADDPDHDGDPQQDVPDEPDVTDPQKK